MHKGVILLIKASDKNEAKDKVQEFMVQYGDGDIWDWYVIGGRWSGTLNSKSKEFFEKVDGTTSRYWVAMPRNETRTF